MNTEFWNKFEQLCEMSGKTPTGASLSDNKKEEKGNIK